MATKYTKEILEALVKESNSVADVLRKLGLSINGGIHSHISRRIEYFGISTEHFQKKSEHLKRFGGQNKKTPDEIFQTSRNKRLDVKQLRRALLDSGVENKCHICSIGPEWNGQPLVLEIDHINSDWRDNRKENLRFLCPNCHAQETKKQRNKPS